MTAERTADLSARIGEPLGETPWMRISQQNINRFGELTGDTQWIHTDPYRAAHTPFGGTIVHGAPSPSPGSCSPQRVPPCL